VLHVDPVSPRDDRVLLAVEALRAGGVLAIPTETFYGLAADSRAEQAARRLNELKRKPDDSPVLLLMASIDQAPEVASNLSPVFHKLAAAFWPGPLTLVVHAAPGLSDTVTGGRGTVGIRVPGLALPRRIAERLERPITGISANLHGRPACRTAAEVHHAFPDGLAMILDGGPTPGGVASTILDVTGPRPVLLRAGAVPIDALRPFVPTLADAAQDV
jgi:L-threonylcarbamoyladenylate synthase